MVCLFLGNLEPTGFFLGKIFRKYPQLWMRHQVEAKPQQYLGGTQVAVFRVADGKSVMMELAIDAGESHLYSRQQEAQVADVAGSAGDYVFQKSALLTVKQDVLPQDMVQGPGLAQRQVARCSLDPAFQTKGGGTMARAVVRFVRCPQEGVRIIGPQIGFQNCPVGDDIDGAAAFRQDGMQAQARFRRKMFL